MYVPAAWGAYSASQIPYVDLWEGGRGGEGRREEERDEEGRGNET